MNPGPSRATLVEVLEAIPEPSLLVGVDGRVVAANRGGRAIFGVSATDPENAGEATGTGDPADLRERVEDPEALRSFLLAASGSRSPLPGSLTVAAAGEATRYRCTGAAVRSVGAPDEVRVLLRISASPDPSSRFLLLNEKIDELHAEIQERKRIEKDLRRSRFFLEETQGIARMGSWEWDVEADVITWSDELYRIYGLDPAAETPDYERFLELVAPEDRQRVHEAVSRAMETGESFSFDHGIVRPDGTRRIVHGRGQAIVDPQGRPVRLRGSGQDITERKRREEHRRFLADAGEILASALDYEQTLEQVARLAVPEIAAWCAVDVVEGERTERLALAHEDPEIERLARDAYRRWSPELGPSSVVGGVLASGEAVLLTEISDQQLREAARDAEHLEFLLGLDIRSAMIVPMTVRDRVLGAITFVADSSRGSFGEDDLAFALQLAGRAALAMENARAYRDAKRAIQAREDMVAVVSHDLRGPLSAIAGAVSLMTDLPLSEEKRAEQLGVIRRSVQHMDHLTQDLLDVARLEAGRLSLRTAEESVGAVVASVEEMWQPKIDAKSIAFRSEAEPGLPTARFDRERIEQVLNNLVGNAVKFTPAGGEIVLAVAREGDAVRFEVGDTGPGIAEDQFAYLFDRFWQGEVGKEGGAGLGLAIARGLVEAHGGRIEAENREEGAVFRFWIPIEPEYDRLASAAPT